MAENETFDRERKASAVPMVEESGWPPQGADLSAGGCLASVRRTGLEGLAGVALAAPVAGSNVGVGSDE